MGLQAVYPCTLFYRFISENLCAYLAESDGVDYASMPDDQAEWGRIETVKEKGFFILMRPYRIVAIERILNRILVSENDKGMLGTLRAGGYVRNATGSGRTLTGFKTAQLASQMDGVDKVMFVVDRKGPNRIQAERPGEKLKVALICSFGPNEADDGYGLLRRGLRHGEP